MTSYNILHTGNRTTLLPLLLLLLLPAISWSVRISVVKHWSAAVSESDTAKLACKANTGAEIKECKWSHRRRGYEFSSEGRQSSRDNEVVSLDRTKGSSLDNMCYFTIDSVNFDQAGDWECTLYSDCEDQEEDREEDFGSEDDGEGFFGRKRRQVEDRRCKASGCKNDDYCNNQASQTVNIGVFSRQDIGALPAQRVYHANAGEEASLTVRTNEEFDSCRVRKGRDDIVDISDRDRGQQCGDMPGRTGGRVCVRITRGVPSCIITIDRVEANMEGSWSVSIEREERGRNVSKTAEVELVMVELPDSVTLLYEDKTFRDTDRDPSLAAALGRARIQCVAEGGRPQPEIDLFAGGRNVSEDGSWTSCRGEGRNSFCVQYDLDITADMSGDSISCLARMPDVDSEDGRFDSQNSRLVSNGKEVSVRLELGFPAQLVDSDPRDNTTITICDTRLCVGDRYTLALEFDSNPEPDTVEWIIRSNDRRSSVVVREGERRRDYEAGRLETVRTSRYPDRFRADLAFSRLTEEDADFRTEHMLKVTNTAGTAEFTIKVDTGRRCGCTGGAGGGGGGVGGGDFGGGGGGDRFEVSGDVKPLLSSCLALGSSLLETYLPDGNRRPSNNREQDFQDKVEDFFSQAACSNYGNEIFNNYKFSQRQEPFQRDSVDIVFHKLDPSAAVIKTKLETEATSRQDLVKIAQTVVEENNKLNTDEETAPGGNTETPGEEEEDTTAFPG